MSDHDTMLSDAERRYRAGDFRGARTRCRELLSSDAPSAVRERADEILAATGIDPAAIAAFTFSLAVLLFIVVRYLL